jgi:deoxyribonuclease V
MPRERLHPWTLSPKEAIELQKTLAERLVLSWDGRDIGAVAGVDVSVRDGVSRAAIVLMSFPDLEPLAATCSERPTPFPYVPGLLTFREGPVVLDAWERLPAEPDVVLFDGQGIAHPRRLGLAAHMGLWLDVPTIGCAKSRLYGLYEEPGSRKGDRTPLRDEREPDHAIGSVLRSRDGVKPLFVSPGHRIDVAQATILVLACCRGYRLPEPTRCAHRTAGAAGDSSRR